MFLKNVIKNYLRFSAGFKVCGFKKEAVQDCLEAQQFLLKGGRNRHTGGTKQNSQSSRSHAIFTIYAQTKNE